MSFWPVFYSFEEGKKQESFIDAGLRADCRGEVKNVVQLLLAFGIFLLIAG
jgi:hypothetical protein